MPLLFHIYSVVTKHFLGTRQRAWKKKEIPCVLAAHKITQKNKIFQKLKPPSREQGSLTFVVRWGEAELVTEATCSSRGHGAATLFKNNSRGHTRPPKAAQGTDWQFGALLLLLFRSVLCIWSNDGFMKLHLAPEESTVTQDKQKEALEIERKTRTIFSDVQLLARPG